MNPRVSIGMPVYNEDKFLLESLKSLLDQEYDHLEIIISDNASTDATQEICRGIAAQDNRVTYYRQNHNRGAAENFRQVLDLAGGQYFMWASGHDLWSPNLVSECVKLLEQEPEAVIAFGSSRWINAQAKPLRRFSGWTDTRGMDSVARFYSVFWGNMHPILGVIRTESLHKTLGILETAGADLILLTELALQGHFVHATAASWYRRDFREVESYTQRMKRYQGRTYGLSKSLYSKIFPLMRLPFELIKSVLRSKITMLEKFCLLFTLLPALPVKYLLTRKRQTGRNAK